MWEVRAGSATSTNTKAPVAATELPTTNATTATTTFTTAAAATAATIHKHQRWEFACQAPESQS